MEAELKPAEAGTFEVLPITPTKQAVIPPYTEWTWSVRPLRAGSHRLYLSVVAIIKLSDGKSEQKALSKISEIHVEVSPGYIVRAFAAKNWQWLLGSPVVLGAVSWLLARRTKRKGRAGFRT
jgi:hypothetical protein